ncbi:MAG TPA: S1 RNA-binding domain-containing protein, partial [bacterium]|nr:S1 RNA-binding domain-containing protein [bacterium]
DNTGVHPEKYEIIGAVCERANVPLNSVLGNKEEVLKLFNDPQVVGELGEYTVKDVIEELKKPGRDPRSIFKKVEFHEGINSIEDLKAGMIVNGVVSNITNFGVFVDIGVHVDGLVHISELSDRGPVRDPRDVVSLGAELKVKVMEVDTTKKQISLSLKQAVHQIKEETKERTKVKNDAYQKMFDEKIYDNTPRPRPQGPRNQQGPRPNARKEAPAPRVNPNSPFAKLMDIRNKVTKK